MASKDLMDRIRRGHGLTAIIDRLSKPVAEGLGEHLSPHLRAGEALPDLELVQQLAGRLVRARLEALLAQEELEGDREGS